MLTAKSCSFAPDTAVFFCKESWQGRLGIDLKTPTTLASGSTDWAATNNI